jgi:predicted CoA-binding protein
MEKVTMVIGASPNPKRVSNIALKKLTKMNIPFIAIGRGDYDLGDIKIIKGMPEDVKKVHTVTLYMNARNQIDYYNYILSLQPERIIFNPGSNNPELTRLALEQGINVVEGCMLIMIATGRF